MTYFRAVSLSAIERVQAADTINDIRSAYFLLEAALEVDGCSMDDQETKMSKILYFLGLFDEQFLQLLEKLEKIIH